MGARVLEIGAGIGNISGWLMPRDRYVASDINPFYLDYLTNLAINRPYMEVKRIDLQDSSTFATLQEQFDTIVCLNVLEHVPDPLVALRNMNSALQDGRPRADLRAAGAVALLFARHGARSPLPLHAGDVAAGARSHRLHGRIDHRFQSSVDAGVVSERTDPQAQSPQSSAAEDLRHDGAAAAPHRSLDSVSTGRRHRRRAKDSGSHVGRLPLEPATGQRRRPGPPGPGSDARQRHQARSHDDRATTPRRRGTEKSRSCFFPVSLPASPSLALCLS